jgi:acyl-CoA synthetase (AMP-forming)/AMP-acid ligase II
MTVGVASPVVDLRVVDPPTEEAVGTGEVGEIRCRSRAMFRGYWNDAARTGEALDADGFLRTGDLGFIDDDGNLRIVGRLKEMYIRGGYNVYPSEVESVLVDHPAVHQAAVIGVEAPVLGEMGVAFVIPEVGVDAPDLEVLRAWCRARLADYKAPDRLVILATLPVTAGHKIDKQALADIAKDAD